MSYGLTDEEWEKLKGLLQKKEGKSGRPCLDLRRTLSGIKWVLKTEVRGAISRRSLVTGTASTDIFATCNKKEFLKRYLPS